MGRYYYSGKDEADYLKKISIYFLNQNKYFETAWHSGDISWSRNGEKTGSITVEYNVDRTEYYLRFIYTQTNNDTGEKKDFNYKVSLATTPCHYGGVRYWFICPLTVNGKPCNRRVGVLYKNGDYFGCRHCYNLTYSSRNKNRRFRYNPMFNVLDYSQKIEELEAKSKRRFYAGRLTKTSQKIVKLRKKISNLSHLI